jgi:hypothetical protein
MCDQFIRERYVKTYFYKMMDEFYSVKEAGYKDSLLIKRRLKREQ